MGLDSAVPHWYMYPPKCSYSDCEAYTYDALPTPAIASSFYVHVPFCNMKCSFCSLFTSVGYSETVADNYVAHLVKEINNTAKQFGHLRSPVLYFGGGTPALLSERHLEMIMGALTPIMSQESSTRSVEFSPDVVTEGRMKTWRNQGFDRVSVGIQSFDDQRLSVMRRHHDGKTARKAIKDLSSAGFTSVNIDLVFGGHGQTLNHWQTDLETALSSGANSCTFHPLALISKTPNERKLDNVAVATNDLATLHHEAIRAFSEAGWRRTSAISFSRTGSPNPLEQAEAEGLDTFGFGAGSRSYLGSLHLSTLPASSKLSFGRILNSYYEAVDQQKKPALSAALLNNEEIIRRQIILNIHHGTIASDLIKLATPFEGNSQSLTLLEQELEPLAGDKPNTIYRIRDEALPTLASLGISLASDKVRADVLRTISEART